MRKNYSYITEKENKKNEFNLIDFLFIISTKWKLILITAFPFFILGVFLSLTRPSLYKSETVLMVSSGMNNINLDDSDITLNQKLVLTYSEVAKSRSILRRIIKKYDLNVSIQSLSKSISISPVKTTELIKISYINKDPLLSAVVLNEFSKEFMNKITEVMSIRNIKVVEKADVPTNYLPKKKIIIIFLFSFIGLFIGFFIAFISEVLFRKLKNPEEIEKILDAPMIGVIPNFKKEEKGELK